MRPTALLFSLLLTVLVGICEADEKPTLSPGAPPWFATVGQVRPEKGNLILYQTTVRFVAEEATRNAMVNGKVQPAKQRITKPVYEQLSRGISLESAKFAEAGGKKIEAADVAKRLEAGTVVVVSTDGKEIDPTYLKALAKDTIVIVDIGVTYQAIESGAFPPTVDYQDPEVLPRRLRVDH